MGGERRAEGCGFDKEIGVDLVSDFWWQGQKWERLVRSCYAWFVMGSDEVGR